MGLFTLTTKGLKKDYRDDLIAALTVSVLLVPQGMAYATIAGLPPVYGLYTAVIPSLIYPIFGSSRHVSAGPTAVISLLIFFSISKHAVPESAEFISLTILVSFISGILFLIAALFRLGFLSRIISHPVIAGFTSAAAFLIIVSQVHNLTGIPVPDGGPIFNKIASIFTNMSDFHFPTVSLGLGSLLLIVLFRKWNRKVPGALLVVILGIIIVALCRLDEQGVEIIQDIPIGLPNFTMPSFEMSSILKILPFAFLLTLISFMEAFAIAKTIANRAGYYTIDPNRELLGLGVSNFVSSFFQCYPSTSSFSRSALNYDSGARSGWSSIFAAIAVALVLLFLTQYLYYLPKAILAAIIIVAVYRLISVSEMKEIWSYCKLDFLVFLVTFIITFLVEIEKGIFTGIVLAGVLLIVRLVKDKQLSLKNLFGEREIVVQQEDVDKDIKQKNPIHYMNFEREIRHIRNLILEGKKKAIKMDLNSCYVDSSGYAALYQLKNNLKEKGIDLHFIDDSLS